MPPTGLGLMSVALCVLVLAILWRQVGRMSRTIHEWEQGLLYVDGRFAGVLGPGRSRTLGRSDRLVVTLPRGLSFENLFALKVTSADRLLYRVSATIAFEIVDPRAAHAGNYREALKLAVTDALVHAAARSVEAMLADRPGLGAALASDVPQPVAGCRLASITVTALTLPPDPRRLYVEVERARLESQAALERARGEQAALRSLANAARMLKGNPELMNLRLIQALSPSGGKGGATLVLGRDALVAARPGDAATMEQDS
ncbi:SPFH domain-containing protein [Methylobacterium variabile]|jgi:regulator of protease activity HflC (stomatin/prohibitin superfamily)|nr:SPFH domain-containing protein [Methylobacterium variabile]